MKKTVGLSLRKSQSQKALTQAVVWARRGLIYDGKWRERTDSTNLLIGKDSFDMQIIADAMVGGFELRLTQELVNKHRRDNNLSFVGLTTVWNAYLRLAPVVSPIRKQKQGTMEVTSPWAKTRMEFVTKILFQFGLLRLEKSQILMKGYQTTSTLTS